MKVYNSIKCGVFFLFTILVFLGCNNPETQKPQTEIVQSPESYEPQTLIVEIKDMKFQPEKLTVHLGDTVIWINKDIVAHDVTEINNAWASPSLASEATWKKAIINSDSYYCSIHVVMKGELTVEE